MIHWYFLNVICKTLVKASPSLELTQDSVSWSPHQDVSPLVELVMKCACILDQTFL